MLMCAVYAHFYVDLHMPVVNLGGSKEALFVNVIKNLWSKVNLNLRKYFAWSIMLCNCDKPEKYIQ